MQLTALDGRRSNAFRFSTKFLPRLLISKLECSYEILDVTQLEKLDAPIFVHVLGAGYSLDPMLPPTGQLNLVTLGRLAEALRICQRVPESVLVCSGNSFSGVESQASVVRRAAIALGLDPGRIKMLTTPATTQQEAEAFRETYGTNKTVIVVTDALHMPRSIKLFRRVGIDALAAPTNFITGTGPTVLHL